MKIGRKEVKAAKEVNEKRRLSFQTQKPSVLHIVNTKIIQSLKGKSLEKTRLYGSRHNC